MIGNYGRLSFDFQKCIERLTTKGLEILHDRFDCNTFACILLVSQDFTESRNFVVDQFLAQGGKVVTVPISHKKFREEVLKKAKEECLLY